MKRSDKAFCIIQAFTSMLGRDLNDERTIEGLKNRLVRLLFKYSGTTYFIGLAVQFPHLWVSIRKPEGKKSFYYCNLLDHTLEYKPNERTTE